MPRGRKPEGTLKQGADGIWKARVTEKGERPWYSLGTRDETTARRKLGELLARIAREAKAGEQLAAAIPFQRAGLDWLAARERQGIASVASDRPLLERYAFPEFGKVLVGDLRPGHVRNALERAKAAGRKRGTLKHLLNAISAVLHRTWQDGLCAENVALKVDVPDTNEITKTRIVLTDAEIGRFWAAPKVDLEIKLLAVVARVEGGMRTRDLIAWDWSHIDLMAFSWCVVPRTKTGKPQRFEVPEPLRVPLAAWWEEHGRPAEGPVFPVVRGKRAGERRAARNVSFADRLRRALFAAGVWRVPPIEVPAKGRWVKDEVKPAPHPRDPLYFETADTLPVDFHSFRRAFAQALDDAAEVTRKQAMKLTGHSSEEAHERYLRRAGQTAEVLPLPAAVLPALPAPSSSSPPVAEIPDAEIVSSKPHAVESAMNTDPYDPIGSASQAEGREFEPRVPLREKVSDSASIAGSLTGDEPPESGLRGASDPRGIPRGSLNRPIIVSAVGRARRREDELAAVLDEGLLLALRAGGRVDAEAELAMVGLLERGVGLLDAAGGGR